ncbi:PREDICTED: protein regulator of cytokinesis 1-like [Pygoscelis adeliae]|uniref:protein regulator of cytokinesis 1-like n=1 Tax=Pygoscelis adeliae TaxID=9238 RepID=UPI0004F4DB9B|nr:PREDICTED: protein regulator of cytokinesis 1-like [Pygoscelis adeliae]
MRYIADIVNADKMSGRNRKYKIIFSPQKFYACEMVLEEEGVFGDVTCDEWSFYLLPLDEDIISMELPEFFRDYFLEGDHRWINSVARALQLLNSLYGPFGKAYGITLCLSQMSYELWRDLEEASEGDGQGRKPEIGNIFLMDRDTDYVTALCSQVVYEGLVDDTFRIKCGSVDFGPDVTSSDKSIKVLLNAQDKVFSQIRNEHFSSVFGFLSQKSRNLQAQYDRRRSMDIKQMKNFVSQELKGLKQEHRLLSLHIGACESIMKKKTKQDFQEMIKAEHSLLEGFDIRESTSFIEEHIDRQVSPIESLRLMCLLSITENGLIPKDYRSLKTQYLQSYGPEHLLTFHNLKRIGLLTEQSAGETLTAVESKVSKLVTDRAAGKITDAFNSLARKSNFRAISKKLGLIPRVDGEYDLKMPRDMAYVFSGAYVPLSCKIIEQVLERRGWLGLEEVVRLLNGNEFSVSGSAGAGLGAGGPGSLLDMMVAEEESLKERLLKSIALCRKELDTLCRELQLDPCEAEEESTILQMEKNLRTRVEVMLKQKRDRKQELKTLQEQDRDLCDILCTTPFCIDSNAVPSLEDLDRYRRHLASLTAEKEQRREEFVSNKRQIILLMEELDHTPDTSFERDVVCEDEEAFCLSTDNIAALQNLLQQLEARRSLNEAVCTELRSRIVALWERLQVPVEERESSAVHVTGARAKTRKALQLEVDHLEELKLQNMKSVIQAIRAELADYWDKCFYSQEQREGFSPYYDEDYTETLLELHDAEVGKMKSYYETHKDLFEAVRKWEENWKLFLELERKATDPSRFANRGGNLLKEEKQRAKLQKTLSKLQEELESRVQAWEQEHEGIFLVKGQQFMEYVMEQWQLYRLEKEKEKQERHLKKSRQIETEMMYGSTPRTPIKRRVLGPHTPGKVRKLNGTSISSATPNSTVRSAFGGTIYHSPTSRLPPSGGKFGQARTPSRVAAKPPRPGHRERNKENVSQLNGTTLSGGCTPTAPVQRNHSVNSVASTYSEFARELSKASRSDSSSRVLNSTTTTAFC